MGELFDRYVAVDWSAAATPKRGRDSIWIAVADGRDDPVLTNPPTRRAAAAALEALLDGIGGGRRTLVAVDASLGYPRGAARRLGLVGEPPWRSWWEVVADSLVDDHSNHNNRFAVADALNRRTSGAGPFWGCPASSAFDHLAPTKPARFDVPEYRLVEERLRDAGYRPASCWQLLGAGSVGGQTLTLLPVVRRLLVAGRIEAWPFTTGLTAPRPAPGGAVVAETWPTAFGLDLSVHPIRDAAQVDGVARELRRADDTGELARWCSPPLDEASRRAVEDEEGWVLAPADPGDGHRP